MLRSRPTVTGRWRMAPLHGAVVAGTHGFQIAGAKGVCHRLRHFSLGEQHHCTIGRHVGLHLLFTRDRIGAALFGERLCFSRVGLGLVGL